MKVTVRAIGTTRAKDIKWLDSQKYVRELERVIERHSTRVQKEFKSTVRGWKHKPVFPVSNNDTAIAIARFIGPRGPAKDQYNWVHEGVAPRFISPRRAGALHFMRGYKAATVPGRIYSQRAKRSKPWVMSKGFHWPGIRPRNFSALIARKVERDFVRDVQLVAKRFANS